MNKILLILCLVFLVSCFQKEVTSDQIVERQELVYEVNSTTPFTGVVLDYRDNGQLSERYKLKDGKKEGLYEIYYDNRWSSFTFKNDIQQGESLEFHDNGQLSKRYNFKDGKVEGLYEGYYANGQLKIKGTYKNGEEHGESLEFHDNGQVSLKQTYKDGVLEGLYEDYHDNGQLKEKGSYEDGRKYQQGPTYNKDGTRY